MGESSGPYHNVDTWGHPASRFCLCAGFLCGLGLSRGTIVRIKPSLLPAAPETLSICPCLLLLTHLCACSWPRPHPTAPQSTTLSLPWGPLHLLFLKIPPGLSWLRKLGGSKLCGQAAGGRQGRIQGLSSPSPTHCSFLLVQGRSVSLLWRPSTG